MPLAYLRMQWGTLRRQKLSPHTLAIGLAVGTTIGTLPTVWGTSLACFVLACVFRLNQLATQFANYLVYPIQIGLFIPYFLLGKRLAPARFAGLSSTQWQSLSGDWSGAVELVLPYQLCAAIGWLATALPLLVLSYLLARLLLGLSGKFRLRRKLTT